MIRDILKKGTACKEAKEGLPPTRKSKKPCKEATNGTESKETRKAKEPRRHISRNKPIEPGITVKDVGPFGTSMPSG